MKKIKFPELSNDMLEQLTRGAFLTVKDNSGKLNTMTIAWGALGYMWHKPVFMVMVRKSRFTYNLIENTDKFTVSIPLKGQLTKELMVCGTKSGRDIDKFEKCKLSPVELEDFHTPVIDECDLHILCNVVYKQPLDPELMVESIEAVYGSEKDYHTLYYGEIYSVIVK